MLPKSAEKHYKSQQRNSVATLGAIRSLWGRMSDDFDSSWMRLRGPVQDYFEEGQRVAVGGSIAATPSMLFEIGLPDLPIADVSQDAFIGSAVDGRPVGSLLQGGVVAAKGAVGRGYSSTEALAVGGRFLDMVVLTELADAARQASAASIGVRPTVTGYVRMLNPPSCSRCAILAGKFFRWNEGFQRHPRCDCRHIPASEAMSGDLTTDPYAYFESLSKDEQDRAFGRSNARAVRDGADIYRVVNIEQRGLGTAKAGMRWGTPTRATVDDIYRAAGTRTRALKMLEENGYITGPQVAGGNILGPGYEGFGRLGQGGARRAASDAVTAARETGVRDRLNRYTMTEAERRLYDANYLLTEARRTGYVPRSIGANSADIYANRQKVTPSRMASLEQMLAVQVANLRNHPRQVSELARLLGLI